VSLMMGVLLIFFSILFAGISFSMREKKVRVIDKLNEYDASIEREVDARIAVEARKGPIGKIAELLLHSSSKKKSISKSAKKYNQADFSMTYEEYLVVKFMGLISIGFFVFAITKNFVLFTMALVAVYVVPNLVVKAKISKRVKAFDMQLNEGLVMISNALKAGYSFLQSLAVAAEETQPPFSTEFKILLKELSLGIPLEDGLNNLYDRISSEDLQLIINAILIQKDVGGNLSEIIENIAETIRERQRIKNEVKTLTAQGKLSGLIIMIMPSFLGVVIYLFDNSYIEMLFVTLPGRLMLGTAFFSQLLGWLFIRKIINIEY